MPIKQIANPAGVYGETASNEQITITAVNGAAAARQHGDVVVVKTAFDGTTFTTTTSASDKAVLGVISMTGDSSTSAATVPVGGVCKVVIGGVARVNIGANTVAAGDTLGTTTTAGQAGTVTATAGTLIGSALVSQASKDANNCILAVIGKM